MDEQIICSNSESCLHYINSKFEYYKNLLDQEQQTCDQLIQSIREQITFIQYNQKEIIQQLDYFEEESFKTYKENKICLFKMFQHLFCLHREFAFDEVFISQQRINQLFQYRPSLLSNIKKFSTTLLIKLNTQSTINNSKGFSNRADIETFKQMSKTSQMKIPSPISSNEIDLTKFIRDNQTNSKSTLFKFSQIPQHSQSIKSYSLPSKKSYQQIVPCDDALLSAGNKRFVLLFNMNNPEFLHVFDMQTNQTKEYQWDEGVILSLGHVENNLFYLITSTKAFLYDIIKEYINKQEFLYDTLYKNFFLISDDLAYRTKLKAHNQLQSAVFDDYCYYLYTNKDYHQILIKSSLDNFQTELTFNLSLKYPHISYFLGFTVTNKSLFTFLVLDSNGYQLLFSDELTNFNSIQTIPINHSIDPRQILSTYLPKFSSLSNSLKNKKNNKYVKQIWFVLDIRLNCIHCLTYEKYLTKISPNQLTSVQSMSIFQEKLLLASNEFTVEIIDLDELISLGKL